MPKTVEMELAEADRMHGLAVRMRQQKDVASAEALDRKVAAKRKKAIARMGRSPKNPNRSGRVRTVAPVSGSDTHRIL